MRKIGIFAVVVCGLCVGSIAAFAEPTKGPANGMRCPHRTKNTKTCCLYDEKGQQKVCHICRDTSSDKDCANGTDRIVNKPPVKPGQAPNPGESPKPTPTPPDQPQRPDARK